MLCQKIIGLPQKVNHLYTDFMNSRILLTLLLSLSLLDWTGCSKADTPADAPEPIKKIAFYNLVQHADFSLQVPEDWETIEFFDSSYPENTVIAFRNNVRDHDFWANVTVVRNTVPEGTTSRNYALQTIETIAGQLINYKEVEKIEVEQPTTTGTETSFTSSFTGTNDRTAESRHFVQRYGVKGTEAYIVTGTYDSKDAELAIDQVEKSVGSFGLR